MGRPAATHSGKSPVSLTHPANSSAHSADDLIPEENETVLLALKRLSPKESYDRVYRMRRATQLSLSHKLLPKSEWTKPHEDVPYLGPLIKEIEAEHKEKENLDSMTVIRNR